MALAISDGVVFLFDHIWEANYCWAILFDMLHEEDERLVLRFFVRVGAVEALLCDLLEEEVGEVEELFEEGFVECDLIFEQEFLAWCGDLPSGCGAAGLEGAHTSSCPP